MELEKLCKIAKVIRDLLIGLASLITAIAGLISVLIK